MKNINKSMQVATNENHLSDQNYYVDYKIQIGN